MASQCTLRCDWADSGMLLLSGGGQANKSPVHSNLRTVTGCTRVHRGLSFTCRGGLLLIERARGGTDDKLITAVRWLADEINED